MALTSGGRLWGVSPFSRGPLKWITWASGSGPSDFGGTGILFCELGFVGFIGSFPELGSVRFLEFFFLNTTAVGHCSNGTRQNTQADERRRMSRSPTFGFPNEKLMSIGVSDRIHK
jgi:hypothetical protein